MQQHHRPIVRDTSSKKRDSMHVDLLCVWIMGCPVHYPWLGPRSGLRRRCRRVQSKGCTQCCGTASASWPSVWSCRAVIPSQRTPARFRLQRHPPRSSVMSGLPHLQVIAGSTLPYRWHAPLATRTTRCICAAAWLPPLSPVCMLYRSRRETWMHSQEARLVPLMACCQWDCFTFCW